MATTERQIIKGQTVVLEIDVFDALGNRIDPDSTPQLAIIDPNDDVVRAMSATGVIRVDKGRYRFSYSTLVSAKTGLWIDRWRATVNGFITTNDLNFLVLTEESKTEIDGPNLGDDPNIEYSQAEIIGINILLAC